MHTPIYLVRPHPSGDGAQVRGPGLRWALWMEDECLAAELAHWRLKATGGRIVFVDSRGTHIITEHVDAPRSMRGGADAMR